MEVTLNQSEIEAGIRLYLDTQFKINDDQDVTIDMKAGRGENGFSATIDIVPAGTKTEAPKTLNIAEKTARTTKTADTTPAKPEPTPETAPVADSAGQAEAQQAQEGSQDAADVAPADASNSDAPAEQEAPTGEGQPRTSLFAGLSKPKAPDAA